MLKVGMCNSLNEWVKQNKGTMPIERFLNVISLYCLVPMSVINSALADEYIQEKWAKKLARHTGLPLRSFVINKDARSYASGCGS